MSTKAIQKLFDCCRRGNMFDIKNVIEDGEIDLNIRDKWDSTPLYYACLCGHEKLVEYLLQKGAKCDAATFDGERCLYSALTQNIKKMLKDYKAISKDCIRRNNYVEFFRKCYSNEKYKDMCFIVHGVYFFVHKLVLSVRSPYFAYMFTTKWRDRQYVKINNKRVSIVSFELLLSYIYTDRMDIPVEEMENLKLLLKQCDLESILAKVEKIEKEFHFYAATKPRSTTSNISIITVQPQFNSTDLNDSYKYIVPFGIPFSLREKQFPDAVPEIFLIDLPEVDVFNKGFDMRYLFEDGAPVFSDMKFYVDGHIFCGHKLFFCGRSEYFKTLDHFAELSCDESNAHTSNVMLNDISAEVFSIIYTFIYTDSAFIPNELLLEVLHFACLYMLPTLKVFCTNKLKDVLDSENVCSVLKAARLYNLPMLELSCTETMATYLDELVESEEFIELVRSDASQIQNREAMDSIPILDDINFHLLKSSLPMSGACMESENKIQMLDGLITKLDLN